MHRVSTPSNAKKCLILQGFSAFLIFSAALATTQIIAKYSKVLLLLNSKIGSKTGKAYY